MTKRVLCAVALVACGGSGNGKRSPGDTAAQFGPLDVGADWKSYTKLNKASFRSETHGGRMVDTYVNAIGLDAFKAGSDMPVGSIVVKTSKDAADGTDGPIFVMEKRAKGFDPEHGDWWYAIHWENPPPAWAKRLGGPVYWRTPSKKAAYCAECHDNYVTGLGGVPDEHKAW